MKPTNISNSIIIIRKEMADTTMEMTTDMRDLLQSMYKHMKEQDDKIDDIFEMLAKKRKTSNPLAPYRDGLKAVKDICYTEITSKDQKVFIALVCDQKGEKTTTKIPIFSLTYNIFMDFMDTYNSLKDGEKVQIPTEAIFKRRYAEKLMDTWTMPDNLK